MPIRFVCPQCQQRLTVSRRRAGERARCPRCQRILQIPEQTSEDSPISSETIIATPAVHEAAEEDPLVHLAALERAHQVVDPQEVHVQTAAPREALPVDFSKVTVSRRVLYAQGILLVLVGIGCFIFGFLAGTRWSAYGGNAAPPAGPALLAGRVTFSRGRGDAQADEGAVILAVPQHLRPDEKAPIRGLRPSDPMPESEHPGLVMIQSLGGDYARVDSTGRFRLRLSAGGDYFVLLISRHARSGDELPQRTTLAQLGRYFLGAPDLLEGQQYRWLSRRIEGQTRIEVQFQDVDQ